MNEPANSGTTIYYSNSTTPRKEIKYSSGPLACPYSGPDSEWDNPPYKTKNVYIWGNDVRKFRVDKESKGPSFSQSMTKMLTKILKYHFIKKFSFFLKKIDIPSNQKKKNLELSLQRNIMYDRIYNAR